MRDKPIAHNGGTVMPSECMAVVERVASLPVNWDALSAVGTVSATIVALFLPWWMSKKEKAKDKANHREVASTVERILAYREAAIAIYKAEPIYHSGVLALKRIGLNAQILSDLLRLLQVKPGLSDGALYSALAAQQIALDIIGTTSAVIDGWGVRDPKWVLRKMVLEKHDQLAGMVQQRVDGVRASSKLDPSKGAAAIRAKYPPLADAIEEAMRLGTGEPGNNLEASYY